MTSDMSAPAPGQRYRHRKFFCLLGTLILMAAAASAVYIANATHLLQTARLLTLCGLTGLIGWWLLWFGLAGLATRQVVLVPDVTPPLPQDPGDMQDRITTLETRLEHAPIALFAIEKIPTLIQSMP